MRGAQPKNKTEKEKENLISNEKNCAMASAVLAGKDRKRILLAKFLSPISAKEQKNCFVRAHQLLFFWRRLQGMRCFQRGADFFSSCYNSFRDHGFFDTFFWRAWGGGHGGASSLSASDSTTINTTDTRDRQHDDDFEKGLDCGDHLSIAVILDRLAIACRDRHAPLAIEIDRIDSAEHYPHRELQNNPLSPTTNHYATL